MSTHSMKAFRELLKTIGSGTHTGKDLTRKESATALMMMLQGEATPAQIGAFMIAHRIKRPTPEELAGMIDAYNELGQRFAPLTDPVVVFGNPYDGRTRTALMLTHSGVKVILQGGGRMPTKYGIPLVELFSGLGLDFASLSFPQAQALLAATGLGFYYLPQHFPQAQHLVPYRDQIGKRPPIATLELIWSPYAGQAHVVSGFVHPPTEERFQKIFTDLKTPHYTTVKGQEGSCDLPCSRTSIIGLGTPEGMERLHLHPRDFGFAEKDIPLDEATIISELQTTLAGKETQLTASAIYNGGFYLWRFGITTTLEAGFKTAEHLLSQGKIAQQLERVKENVGSYQ